MLKEISTLLQLSFEENFFMKVLLICENGCKRSFFLINFSVEICNGWFTFSSRVLVQTFGKMWMRQSTHECRHSPSCPRIVNNKARHSRHLISFDFGLIYRHVSGSFKMRQEQVESVENETNVPFTLSFSSCLVLSRWECKPGIKDSCWWLPFLCVNGLATTAEVYKNCFFTNRSCSRPNVNEA